MSPAVSNAPPLDRLHGIRDHFAEGGSGSAVIWVLVITLSAILIAYLVTAIIGWRSRRRTNHPGHLFKELLFALPLTHQQQVLLRSVAADLRLDHPSIMLISPEAFRRHGQAWLGGLPKQPPDTSNEFQRIASALFPINREN